MGLNNRLQRIRVCLLPANADTAVEGATTEIRFLSSAKQGKWIHSRSLRAYAVYAMRDKAVTKEANCMH